MIGLLQQCGLRQSFSHVGMPGDNAWSESFFATMKKELIHRTHYETKESIRVAVFDYMSPREYFRSLRTGGLADAA